MNGMHVTMYPVSVSIFTDQWLIGPTNPLQTSIGKQTRAQGFQHVWSGVLAKFWFQAKRENPWACLVEVISADRWTTWLVFFKQFEWYRIIGLYWIIGLYQIIEPWTTWLVSSSISFPHICFHTFILAIWKSCWNGSYFQLFEGECVPDFDRLKVELLKEEVSSP